MPSVTQPTRWSPSRPRSGIPLSIESRRSPMRARKLRARASSVHSDLVTVTARQTPVASDLRLILAMIELAQHITLIANQFDLISQQLADVDPSAIDREQTGERLVLMSEAASAQLRKATSAFRHRDLTAARELDRDDDTLDVLNLEITNTVTRLEVSPDEREARFPSRPGRPVARADRRQRGRHRRTGRVLDDRRTERVLRRLPAPRPNQTCGRSYPVGGCELSTITERADQQAPARQAGHEPGRARICGAGRRPMGSRVQRQGSRRDARLDAPRRGLSPALAERAAPHLSRTRRIRCWFAALKHWRHQHRVNLIEVTRSDDGQMLAVGTLSQSNPNLTPFCALHRFADGLIIAAHHHMSDPDSLLAVCPPGPADR